MANQVASLRMEQRFKKTPVGNIPVDWDVVKLGDVANQSEARIEPARDDKRPYIGLEHIGSGDGRLRAVGSSDTVTSLKTVFQKDDILFGKLRPNLRKIALAPFDGICSTDIIVITPGDAVRRDFLFYRLHSGEAFDFAVGTAAGTKMPRTSWFLFRNYAFACPPLSEQKRIAEILSAVDEAIEKTTAVIRKTKELRNGLVRLIFNSKTGHGQSRPSWQIVNLRLLCELITKGTTPTTYGFKFTDSGVRFIKIENIGKNGEILPSGTTYISEETHQALRRSILRKDDILFSIAGALGRSCVVAEDILPANTNQAVAIIRLKREKADSSYVRYFLDSDVIRMRIENIGTQGAQINLSLAQVGDMPIPLPSLAEQRRIAGIIATLDDQIFREMCFKQNLEQTKLALMRVLLTGKIRVCQEA